ncbi:MAG: hypothetical protein WCH46_06845 [bacterium]
MKILVFADYEDIGQRKNYEQALLEELSDKGVQIFMSIDYFPPLKEYTDQEREANKISLGYTAVLFLEPKGSNTSTHSEAYRNWFGGVSADTHESLDGVYTIATLTDLTSKEHVYKATIYTSLDSRYTQMNEVRSSMAKKIADDMSDNGFFNK